MGYGDGVLPKDLTVMRLPCNHEFLQATCNAAYHDNNDHAIRCVGRISFYYVLIYVSVKNAAIGVLLQRRPQLVQSDCV